MVAADECVDELKIIVSVVIPAHNSESTVISAIDSVLRQEISNIEVIIVNDCSTDETEKVILGRYSQDPRVVMLTTEENLGGGGARNMGISHASGRYIAFLDADDSWEVGKLDEQLRILHKSPDVALVYSPYWSIDAAGKRKLVTPPEFLTRNRLRFTNDVCCSSAVIDSSKIACCKFPEIRYRQDWGLWISVLEAGFKAQSTTKPYVVYRNFGGISANKSKVIFKQWEFFRSHCGYSLFESVVFFLLYGFFGFVKRYLKFNI